MLNPASQKLLQLLTFGAFAAPIACTQYEAVDTSSEAPDEETSAPVTGVELPGVLVSPGGNSSVPVAVPSAQVAAPTKTPSICQPGETLNMLPPRSALDLSPWGLNIPFDERGEDGPALKSAWVQGAALDQYVLPWYYETNACGNGVIFRAHAGGATTGGSGYPRSELREMNASGSSRFSWNSSIGRHTMRIVQSINHLPDIKTDVVAGQIHDEDDVTVVRLEGSELYMTDGNKKMKPPIDEQYQLGTPFEVMYVVEDDVTNLYFRLRRDLQTGEEAPGPFDLSKPAGTLALSYSGAYFKAGCYTQSSCGGDKKVPSEACSAYAEVEIFELEVKHE